MAYQQSITIAKNVTSTGLALGPDETYDATSATVQNGGVAEDFEIYGGFDGNNYIGGIMSLTYGSAYGTTINESGRMSLTHGKAYDTILNSGIIYLKNTGAVLDNTKMYAGQIAMSAGTANDTFVYGGTFNVKGGTANNIFVYNGAVTSVFAGATADDVEVNLGGKLVVAGEATGIKENGGYVDTTNADNATFVANTIKNLSLAQNTSATVHADTTVENLFINSKCKVDLFGGTLTGTFDRSGTTGKVNVKEDSNVVFNVKGVETGSTLFSTLSSSVFVIDSGKKLNFSITVEDGKQTGTYTLAKNADFIAVGDEISISSIGSTEWTDSITVNGDSLATTASIYTLTKSTYGTLVLEIEGLHSKNYAAANTYDKRINVGIVGGALESEGGSDTEGSYSLTISKGTFNNLVNGGDRLTKANGMITHDGYLSTTISGGTFVKSIGGGMMHDAGTKAGKVIQDGDVFLTIKGGNFTSEGAKVYIFGGNTAAKQSAASAAQSVINGDVSITFDTKSQALTFAKSVYAGSYGKGTIHGNVGITLTGKNTATFNADLWGACSGDTYGEGLVGRRTLDTNIKDLDNNETDRTLTFEGFRNGNNAANLIAGNIGGFNKLVCNDSIVNIATASGKSKTVALGDISNWEIAYGSNISGVFGNNFTGDTLVLGDDTVEFGENDVWEVMNNSASNAYEAFSGFSSVTLLGEDAHYSYADGAWMSDTYQLAINGTKMELSFGSAIA